MSERELTALTDIVSDVHQEAYSEVSGKPEEETWVGTLDPVKMAQVLIDELADRGSGSRRHCSERCGRGSRGRGENCAPSSCEPRPAKEAALAAAMGALDRILPG